MTALDRKMWRDLGRVGGQAATIALVVACGIAIFIAAQVNYYSLRESQRSYYAASRFADIFVSLKRAPNALEARLSEIPGVGQLEARLVFDVTIDVAGIAEPISGRIIGLQGGAGPRLNRLYLRSGRLPAPTSPDEVLVSEGFASTNALRPGTSIAAILNGKKETLRIAGIVLSPEYVFASPAGNPIPDDKRFGVLWMNRDALAAAFNMEGAFNDAVLSVEHGASKPAIMSAVDRLLAPYGGLIAYDRFHQPSDRFLADEIEEQRIMATTVPPVFLAVAAFLVNVVMSRLVHGQRAQIAALKALGYGNGAIAVHYLKFATAIVLAGSILGIGLGIGVGRYMTETYTWFFRFPALSFDLHPALPLAAIVVSQAAALAGAMSAVRAVARLAPAEAMRPAPPRVYGEAPLDRLLGRIRLRAHSQMIVRGITGRPLRALMTVAGIGLSVPLVILSIFWQDALDHMVEVQFAAAERGDATVTFTQPVGDRAVRELARMPAVRHDEGYRIVPVRLGAKNRTYRTVLFGIDPNATLRRLVDENARPIAVLPDGVMLSRRLAERLGVRAGDRLRIEVLEGERAVRTAPLVGLVNDQIGLSGYMNIAALRRLMREGDVVNAVSLAVDSDGTGPLFTALKAVPRIETVNIKALSLRVFRATTAQFITVLSTIFTAFALTIALGVVYNSARIALHERAWDLASLRVLGFSRGEVSRFLLGEIAIETLIAIPIGLWLGRWMVGILTDLHETEMFKVPAVIAPRSYAIAAFTVLAAATISALLVRRRVDRLDLVAVLKARE